MVSLHFRQRMAGNVTLESLDACLDKSDLGGLKAMRAAIHRL